MPRQYFDLFEQERMIFDEVSGTPEAKIVDSILKDTYGPMLLEQLNEPSPFYTLFGGASVNSKQPQNGYGVGQVGATLANPRKLTVRERQINGAASELLFLLRGSETHETLDQYQDYMTKLKKLIAKTPERLLRGVLLELCTESRACRRELRCAGQEIERYRLDRAAARNETVKAQSRLRRLKNALDLVQAIGADLEIE